MVNWKIHQKSCRVVTRRYTRKLKFRLQRPPLPSRYCNYSRKQRRSNLEYKDHQDPWDIGVDLFVLSGSFQIQGSSFRAPSLMTQSKWEQLLTPRNASSISIPVRVSGSLCPGNAVECEVWAVLWAATRVCVPQVEVAAKHRFRARMACVAWIRCR